MKAVDAKVGDSLEEVIDEQNNHRLAGLLTGRPIRRFLDTTKADARRDPQRHLRRQLHAARRTIRFSASFQEVPLRSRNFILYDGFYQWQKTYGPLYCVVDVRQEPLRLDELATSFASTGARAGACTP